MIKLNDVFIIMMLCLSSSAWPIVINKIKIVGNKHTSNMTILAIASELQEGKEFTEDQLEKLIRRIEERLKNTTWFYSARVYIVSTSAGEGYRNVIIEVEEGFLLRFGGGNAYGMFGKDNIGGKGEKILTYLGYNRQGVVGEWDVLPAGFSVSASLGNFEKEYYKLDLSKEEIQRIGINTEIGYRFSWDSRILMRGEFENVFNNKYLFMYHHIMLGTKYVLDTRDDIFSAKKGVFLEGGVKWLRFSYPLLSIDGRYFLPLFSDIRCGWRGVLEVGKNLPEEYKLNLLGINGIRSSISNYPIGNIKILASMETRGKIWKTTLLGFLNIVMEGVIFGDIGSCCEYFEDFKTLFDLRNSIAYGIGGGIRIYFMEPVFVPIRLEVGFDRKLRGQFFFGVTEPF